MNGIPGKRVLVTGGSSGIGQAIAVHFAQLGAHVAINYYADREGAEDTAEQVRREGLDACVTSMREADVQTHLVEADVANANDVARMVRETVDALGGLDVLVSNAGIQVEGAADEIELEAFDRVIATNLRGAFLCARAALRHFLEREQPGVILNVSSVHQTIPKPQFIGYSASKGGLENVTRTLALEYAGRGIRVNAIGPGATATPINSDWVDDPEKRAEVERHIPMGRAGTPEEMAAVAAFLCSDDAAYITGQTLYVDGGLTLYPDFRTAWSS